MKKQRVIKRCLVCFLLLVAIFVYGESTIVIGMDANVEEGTTIEVPLILQDMVIDSSMVLLRLAYDPVVLANPELEEGNITSEDHSLYLHEPESGRVNILVDGGADAVPFTAQNGTVATLKFDVTGSGTANLKITEVDDDILAVSSLLGSDGKNVTHDVQVGEITGITDWPTY